MIPPQLNISSNSVYSAFTYDLWISMYRLIFLFVYVAFKVIEPSVCDETKTLHKTFRFIKVTIHCKELGTSWEWCSLKYTTSKWIIFGYIFRPLFFTEVTPWGVTSVITSFGVNIEWTGRDSTRWVVNFHSTAVRIEWNSLLNEWNFFTPSMEWINHSIFYFLFFLELAIALYEAYSTNQTLVSVKSTNEKCIEITKGFKNHRNLSAYGLTLHHTQKASHQRQPTIETE